MHILPPLETVKEIAAKKQYDVLPLSCETVSYTHLTLPTNREV